MYIVSTEASFCAAHRLRNYEGPCEKLHGHNWLVRAHVKCSRLNEIGIGIDFKELRSALRDVLESFDHGDLNEILGELNPSSENLAHVIYHELKNELNTEDVRMWKVEVYETPGSYAAYVEDD